MSTTPADESEYPPSHHVLRDLPFEIEVVSASEQRAHLDATWIWEMGSLATVVDVLCGSLCAGVIAPDWMATSSLTLRTTGVPVDTALVVDASVLRAGRRSVTLEAELRAVGASGPLGVAVLAFSRLERRDTNLDPSDWVVTPGSRWGFGSVAGAASSSLDPALGLTVLDGAGGVTETPVTPYVRNSFGAVNGGVVAAIGVRAAAATVGAPLDGVDEVSVHHLGQGRVGPVRTSARVVLAGSGRDVVRVELRDAAAADEGDGRLMAVAHVGVSNAAGHV